MYNRFCAIHLEWEILAFFCLLHRGKISTSSGGEPKSSASHMVGPSQWQHL